MAEIQTTSGKKSSKGFSKGKKLSTRVDLTPMVDLVFLLIIFFIFTTSFGQPVAMKIVVPEDTPTSDPNTVSADKTITLLLGDNNKVFYYSGFFNSQVQEINFDQFRPVLIEKKLQLLQKYNKNCLNVLIKPNAGASYKNVVDCLDEMIINDISTYVLNEPNEKELHSLKDVKI